MFRGAANGAAASPGDPALPAVWFASVVQGDACLVVRQRNQVMHLRLMPEHEQRNGIASRREIRRRLKWFLHR